MIKNENVSHSHEIKAIRQVSKYVSEGMMICESDGTINYANQSAARLYGYNSEDELLSAVKGVFKNTVYVFMAFIF